MNNLSLRRAAALLLVLASGACSNSGDTGFDGLLGQGQGQTPAPAASAATVRLSGPDTVAPGVNTTGYVATYLPGARGAANPGVGINLAAAGNANNTGNIVVVSPCGDGGLEQPPNGGGSTDRQGRVCFNYTAPPSVTTPTTITLFATVPGQVDAANRPLGTTLMVTIQPATFQFVQPASNNIGFNSSQPTRLRFQWTRISSSGDGTEGVTGKVQLAATGGGQFTVDGTAAGSVVIVDTSGGAGGTGDFAKSIGVYATTAGAINVTATDQSNGRNSSLMLQARDMPISVNVAAAPRQIPTSGAQSSSTNVTATVASEGGGPSDGSAVTFKLTPVQAGSSERLSITSGKTRRGQIVTEYFAGNRAGTATVEACVDDSTVCGSETITVTAP